MRTVDDPEWLAFETKVCEFITGPEDLVRADADRILRFPRELRHLATMLHPDIFGQPPSQHELSERMRFWSIIVANNRFDASDILDMVRSVVREAIRDAIDKGDIP